MSYHWKLSPNLIISPAIFCIDHFKKLIGTIQKLQQQQYTQQDRNIEPSYAKIARFQLFEIITTQ